MITSGIYLGDCRDLLSGINSEAIRLIHTSPPYNIGKDYLNYEDNLEIKEYMKFLGDVVNECFRVLKNGGSLFWQTGYTTNGDGFIYPLDYLTMPLFVNSGFKLKDRIIWRYFGGRSFKSKFTNKHETILWWVKPGSEALFNIFPIRERSKELDPRNNLFGRNPGNVWEVDRVAFGSYGKTSHIAVFPEEISDRIILSSSITSDICLDPFSGSGTLCKVAKSRGREFIGFEISNDYFQESLERLKTVQPGEFLNVLSEILIMNALTSKNMYSLDRLLESLCLLKSQDLYSNITRYVTQDVIDIIKLKNEETIEKQYKKAIWIALKKYFSHTEYNLDLIKIVDSAYLSRYKLHSRFNEPMRLFKALEWIDKFHQFLSLPSNDLANQIHNLVKCEPYSYSLKNNCVQRKTTKTNINKINEEIPLFK